jgi:pyridoxine kinase
LIVPRVAVLQDLSGFGRCSLSVAMPILSAMGVQCCPILTAFLSSHTGFEGNTFLDMTEEMQRVAAHWKSLHLSFDAIYSGFVGSEAQLHVISDFISDFRKDNTIVLVDPVMGDYGRVYRTYTPSMCRQMVRLAAQADLITPNFTEACILLDEPYENRPVSQTQQMDWLRRLSQGGRRSVILTGICQGENLGAACFDRETQEVSFAFRKKVEGQFHGSGDVFASVTLGALLSGASLSASMEQAVSFVRDCAALTVEAHALPKEGLLIEPCLARLHHPVSK